VREAGFADEAGSRAEDSASRRFKDGQMHSSTIVRQVSEHGRRAVILRPGEGSLTKAICVGLALFCSLGSLPRASAATALKRSIGIITAGGVYSEIVPAGTPLPHIYSSSFGNATDNQTAVEITIAQKGAGGTEKILVAVIDQLPKRPKGKLSMILTVTIDAQKQLRLKATVPETGYLKQFPPLPVE